MCYWQLHIYLSVRSVLHKCKIKNPRIDQFNACTDKIVCSITKSRIIIPLIRTESGKILSEAREARPKSHKKTNPGKKGVPLMEKYQLCFQNNICTFIPEIPHKQELPPTTAIALYCILRCSQILIIKLTLSDPLKPRQQKTEIVAKIIVALKWIRNLRRNTKWFWPFQTELKNPIKKVDSLIS